LVQERSFARIGCAKRGSSAGFCNEAVSLVWQGTKSLYRNGNRNIVTSGGRTVIGRLSRILRHVGCCQCVSNCHITSKWHVIIIIAKVNVWNDTVTLVAGTRTLQNLHYNVAQFVRQFLTVSRNSSRFLSTKLID